MYVEYPHIHGTAEEKIEQISNYLFKLAEVSNYNLDQSTPECIFRQAAEAVTSAESEAIEKGQRAKFGSLRDLIIKSAGSVMISQEEISHSLAGLFVATSDFGTFKKETEQNFSANSESFKSLFKKSEEISTDLTNYKTEMQNYIFAGYDGDTFALDVGLLKDTYTENGKTTENGTPKKIRITPSRLSLFSGDYEAAYLSENAIYFPNANITGGTLNIGSGRFTVDSEGTLSATGAKISGDITATSGSFSGELKAATGSFSGSITATDGTIAGWKIGTGAPGLPATATAIYNEMTENGTKYSIGMQSNFSSTGNINFYVRSQKKNSSDWEDIFYVKNNGKLKAINAEIKGTISASSISASSITNGTYGAGSTGFSLTSDGQLYASGATIYGAIHATSGSFSGSITAKSGSIAGWNIGTGSKYMENSDMLYYTYNNGNSEVGFNPKSTGEVFYIRKFSSSGDYNVISFSKTGSIYTENDINCKSLYSNFGKIECTAAASSSSSSTNPRSADVITVYNNDLVRKFWVSPLGHVGAKKFYTIDDTGNKTGDDLQTQINGKASTGHTHSGYALLTGATFTGAVQSSYFRAGNAYVESKSGATISDAGNACFGQTVKCKALTQTSDRRLKNTIAELDHSFDEFFRKLKPVTFKFNDKKEFSFGFIAQDVKKALAESGHDTEQFDIVQKGEAIYYSINHTQITALNTHMIQIALNENEKLKERITRLEEKILMLTS